MIQITQILHFTTSIAAETFDQSVEEPLQQFRNILQKVNHSLFSVQSVVSFFFFLIASILLGRLVAYLLRRVVTWIGLHADKSQSYQTVNRLRRYETMIIISIAIIRAALIMVALYLWWTYIHPGGQPTALIGASALLAIIIGGALSPTLRDISSGSVMMAEQWYAVGDHVKVEPFGNVEGVVERVTLRSTRLRGLNGKIIWVNNSSIMAIHITPKGIVAMALELFVRDPDGGAELIETVNRRLPKGELLVISPLKIMKTDKVGDDLWHLTAIAETAPSREWIIEKYAIDVMKEINTERDLKLLATDPVSRFADSEAERRFARAINNARKGPRKRRTKTKTKPTAQQS
jgi:hypothetical protein